MTQAGALGRNSAATEKSPTTPRELRPPTTPAERPLRPAARATRAGARLEARRDHLVEDAPRAQVGELVLQPVADLDAHPAVALGDEQQRAVVLLLAAQPPGLGHAVRVGLEHLASQAGHGE